MPDPDWEYSLEHTVEGLILLRTVDRLKTVELAGIEKDRIAPCKVPWMADPQLPEPPCVLVSPAPEATPWDDGTNESDDVTFATFITIVLANQRNVNTKGLGIQLQWRQNIRRKFQNKVIRSWPDLVLPEGNKFIHAWIESGDKFIESALRMQRDAQYYLLRVKVREPRE